jgi:hypothetical protein
MTVTKIADYQNQDTLNTSRLSFPMVGDLWAQRSVRIALVVMTTDTHVVYVQTYQAHGESGANMNDWDWFRPQLMERGSFDNWLRAKFPIVEGPQRPWADVYVSRYLSDIEMARKVWEPLALVLIKQRKKHTRLAKRPHWLTSLIRFLQPWPRKKLNQDMYRSWMYTLVGAVWMAMTIAIATVMLGIVAFIWMQVGANKVTSIPLRFLIAIPHFVLGCYVMILGTRILRVVDRRMQAYIDRNVSKYPE